jgi:hypothetical protein
VFKTSHRVGASSINLALDQDTVFKRDKLERRGVAFQLRCIGQCCNHGSTVVFKYQNKVQLHYRRSLTVEFGDVEYGVNMCGVVITEYLLVNYGVLLLVSPKVLAALTNQRPL